MSLRSSLVSCAVPFFALALAGCPTTGDDDDDATADWAFVSSVLASECSPCHTGAPGDPPADPITVFDEPELAYDALVDYPAAQAPGLNRVEPGDSENSYLIHKLRGSHGDAGGGGERMPFGGPYLDDDVIDAIAEWIDAGAEEVAVTGDDDDSGDDDDDDSVGDDDDSVGTPTFSDVYTTIISTNCSCHSGGSHSTGFAFNGSQQTAYDVLVGVASSELPAMNRIEAGDSTESYLQHKIDGTHLDVGGSGGQMPLGGSLSEAQRDLVRDWIDAGAAND